MFLLFAAKRKLSSSSIPPIFAASDSLLPRCRGYASKKDPKPTNPMLVDYLVATYGFSTDKAALVSKRVAHLKSPDKPEAVRSFLNKEGFSDDQVKAIITLHPKLLYASPENTLDPNLRAIRNIGLSSSTLTQVMLSSPVVLQSSSSAPRILFWRDFFGGDEAAMLRAFKRNAGLISHDISQSIAPKITLLQSQGLSTKDIRSFVLNATRIICSRFSIFEDALNRAKELGFQPESGMFGPGLRAMVYINREQLQKKMELFKGFGWSEDEFHSAVRKAPSMVTLADKNLQTKMGFLVGEAGCDSSYIASSPLLLMFSLEKRLRPRLRVLNLLKSEGVSSKRLSFKSVLQLSDKVFEKEFIVPYKEGIPGLHEAYIAASA